MLLAQRGFVAGSSPADETAVPGIVRLTLKYVGRTAPLAALDAEDKAVTAEAVKAKAAADAAKASAAAGVVEPLDDDDASDDDDVLGGDDDEEDDDDLPPTPPPSLPKTPSQLLAARLAKIAQEASKPPSPPPSAKGKGKKAPAKPKAKASPAVKGRK